MISTFWLLKFRLTTTRTFQEHWTEFDSLSNYNDFIEYILSVLFIWKQSIDDTVIHSFHPICIFLLIQSPCDCNKFIVSFEDCSDYYVVVFTSPEIVRFNGSVTKYRIGVIFQRKCRYI